MKKAISANVTMGGLDKLVTRNNARMTVSEEVIVTMGLVSASMAGMESSASSKLAKIIVQAMASVMS